MGDTNSVRTRSEIPSQDKWTIEEMYKDNDWDEVIDTALRKAEKFEEKYRGNLTSSAKVLCSALKENDEISLALEEAYCFARMKLDEDNNDPDSQARYNKCVSILSKAEALTSFMMPEIVKLDSKALDEYIKEEPELKTNEHLLRSAIREAEHVLTEKEERILARFSEVISAPDNVFTMLNDADISFGKVKDYDGNEVDLTHGTYITLMRSHNRDVRKNAYEHTYNTYKGLINTIAANYQTNVKADVISASLRNYASSMEASMFGEDIPIDVYTNLIKSVRSALPSLHKYMGIRKKALNLNELKMYDVYVPIIELPEKKVSFTDAVTYAKNGLAPLGKDYINDFLSGIDSGWIDKYENKGKTSGAYSFGSYKSKPYILMNFDGTLEDVFTLVHEMGHSMNSLYTRRSQPFCYGDHSIFTAEVASTVNETLMMRYLLDSEDDPNMKKYVLNMYIEAFRTTLFRQTMFAEFEKKVHEKVEHGESLTAEGLSETYDKLNSDYFGPSVEHDDLIKYEWARIPHFYRSFYVYQYATGYSAANAIANRILGGVPGALDDYLHFLRCGTNDYPVELLKIAGVDMSKESPILSALSTFDDLVSTLGNMM